MRDYIVTLQDDTPDDAYMVIGYICEQPELVRCKNCLWWDSEEYGGTLGYCHAAKHGYVSQNWEISIYRTTKPEFFCADGEKEELSKAYSDIDEMFEDLNKED